MAVHTASLVLCYIAAHLRVGALQKPSSLCPNTNFEWLVSLNLINLNHDVIVT